MTSAQNVQSTAHIQVVGVGRLVLARNRIGTILNARYGEFDDKTLEDFNLVPGAALTLLGL